MPTVSPLSNINGRPRALLKTPPTYSNEPTSTKNKTIPTNEIYGYKYINHRTGGIRGISILFKGNLYNNIKCLDELQSENVLLLSIKHLLIIVVALYIPPQN